MYKSAQGTTRVKGVDGAVIFSKTFDRRRGVIQGDIVRPIVFVLALDQLVQTLDANSEGISVGHII